LNSLKEYRGKALKNRLKDLLSKANLKEVFDLSKELEHSERILGYLTGFFCEKDEELKWKAVILFGRLCARLAEEDLERARIVIRRLLWMLNEESGGMAWGVPEGFAEALYHSEALKEVYIDIFISYLWDTEGTGKYKADNYLEFSPAQRGVVWGIGRLAQKYEKDVVKANGHEHLKKHLNSPDQVVVLLSAWSLLQFSSLGSENLKSIKNSLLSISDNTNCLIFDGKNLVTLSPSFILKALTI